MSIAQSAYRILIVEDQRDLARAIAMALASLEANLQVLQVPSGEEALLELRRQGVDILITDLRLPGMSGQDLAAWVRRHHPETRVFLISGLPQDEVREAAEQMQADEVFRKPLEMADLLDAVERYLGLVETFTGPAQTKANAETVRQETQRRLVEYLTEQRQALDLEALMLVGEGGRVLLRAGDWPGPVKEDRLLTRLLAVTSAGVKVARELGQKPPRNAFAFAGADYGLVLISLDEEYYLLAWSAATEARHLAEIEARLWSLVPTLREALQSMGLVPQTGELQAWQPPLPAMTADDEAPAEAGLELGELFGAVPDFDPQEAERFWEEVSTQDDNAVLLPDSLTFEQARALGLVPGEEDDGSE